MVAVICEKIRTGPGPIAPKKGKKTGLDWTFKHYLKEQFAYNLAEEKALEAKMLPLLNSEQHNTFDQIWCSVSCELGLSFFLNGIGSCGKTFLYNTVCH